MLKARIAQWSPLIGAVGAVVIALLIGRFTAGTDSDPVVPPDALDGQFTPTKAVEDKLEWCKEMLFAQDRRLESLEEQVHKLEAPMVLTPRRGGDRDVVVEEVSDGVGSAESEDCFPVDADAGGDEGRADARPVL